MSPLWRFGMYALVEIMGWMMDEMDEMGSVFGVLGIMF